MPKHNPWFAIRTPLSAQRQILLTICSFLIPLLLWCVVSYVPALWHPDMVVQISADRQDVTTVYSVGDRLPRYKEFESDFAFEDFVEAVQVNNAKIKAARNAGEPIPQSTRLNKKVLRHIAPVALEEGWINRDQVNEDELLYDFWGQIARGEESPKKLPLSDENLDIIQSNWQKLSKLSPVYNSKLLPDDALLSLVPQGKPANPVYVPAPHEVIETGWYDWTREYDPDMASMWDRYRHSLFIVFSGFALSCLLGIPFGVLAGTYDFFAKIIEPFTDFFRYMPAPAFSTVLVAILSVYDAPKVGLVFIGTFFQMVLVISNTTRLLDRSLIEAAQTLGARSRHLMFRVIIPGILPKLYNDLRILLGWSWTWLVIAELVGTKSGLTEFIETQGRFRNFESVYPAIIIIGITGYLSDQILATIRPLLFPWDSNNAGKKPGFIVRTFSWIVSRDAYALPEKQKPLLDKTDTSNG